MASTWAEALGLMLSDTCDMEAWEDRAACRMVQIQQHHAYTVVLAIPVCRQQHLPLHITASLHLASRHCRQWQAPKDNPF